MSKYPAITIPSGLALPQIPSRQEDTHAYLRALHEVLSRMQASNAQAFDVLNYYRTVASPSGDDLAEIPSASNSGLMYIDSNTGRVFYDNRTAAPPVWQEFIPSGIKVNETEPLDSTLRINEGKFWYEFPDA